MKKKKMVIFLINCGDHHLAAADQYMGSQK